MGGPWGSMRSGDLEQVELVFGHFPFQSPTIRNAGHRKQTPAHDLWGKMETCSIGESAQKKDQGSRDGDGETKPSRETRRRRPQTQDAPEQWGSTSGSQSFTGVAYSYPAYQIFTL